MNNSKSESGIPELLKSPVFSFFAGATCVVLIAASLPANTLERWGELSNQVKCNLVLGGIYQNRICDLRVK